MLGSEVQFSTQDSSVLCLQSSPSSPLPLPYCFSSSSSTIFQKFKYDRHSRNEITWEFTMPSETLSAAPMALLTSIPLALDSILLFQWSLPDLWAPCSSLHSSLLITCTWSLHCVVSCSLLWTELPFILWEQQLAWSSLEKQRSLLLLSRAYMLGRIRTHYVWMVWKVISNVFQVSGKELSM